MMMLKFIPNLCISLKQKTFLERLITYYNMYIIILNESFQNSFLFQRNTNDRNTSYHHHFHNLLLSNAQHVTYKLFKQFKYVKVFKAESEQEDLWQEKSDKTRRILIQFRLWSVQSIRTENMVEVWVVFKVKCIPSPHSWPRSCRCFSHSRSYRIIWICW